MRFQSTPLSTKFPFKRRRLYLAIAAVSLMAAGRGYALPDLGDNGVVIGGSIDTSNPNETTIDQEQQRMLIEWESFNLDDGEHVRFNQEKNHIALNKVIGGSRSNIHGKISGDGHVILVNPQGIVFGSTAEINVGSFIASGLKLDTDDFIDGSDDLFLIATADEGSVVNNGGTITGAAGGSIILIGKQVSNEGVIKVGDDGAVALAAGTKAVLSVGSGLWGISISEADVAQIGGVLNTGEVEAAGGQIVMSASAGPDLFAAAVNRSGFSDHVASVIHEDGSFTLTAGGNVTNSGVLSTSADSGAGDVLLLGRDVTNTGEIDAASENADGGFIELHAYETLQQSGSMSTASASADGGEIRLLGKRVGVAASSEIDASGGSNGGTILVGGDRQGLNPQIRNADQTIVASGAVLLANALSGGRVAVWADNSTRFHGRIEATGSNSEASVAANSNLEFNGGAQLNGGTLTLSSRELSVGGNLVADNPGADDFDDDWIPVQTISASKLAELLSQQTVVLQADDGLSVTAAVIASEGSTHGLELSSGGRVDIEAGLALDQGDIRIVAGRVGCGGEAAPCGDNGARGVQLQSSATVTTAGNVEILAADNINLDGSIGSAAGGPSSLSVRAGNAISIDGAINTGHSAVSSGPRIKLAAGDQSLSEDGITVANSTGAGTGSPPPASLTINNAIHSHGGDIHLAAFYDAQRAQESGAGTAFANVRVSDSGSISTGGGDLVVGSSEDRVGRFISESALRTDSEPRGGDIKIYAEHDIALNSASFGGTTTEGVPGASDVGSLWAESSKGNISLSGSYEYNSRKEGAGGSITLKSDNGSITLAEFTADDTSEGTSRLDMDLRANGAIDIGINGSAWLNGGTFYASSETSSITIKGGTLETEGGSVTLSANNIGLGGTAIQTIGDLFNRDGGSIAINGNLELLSDVSLSTGGSEESSRARGTVSVTGSIRSHDGQASNLDIIAGHMIVAGAVSGVDELSINSTGNVEFVNSAEHGIRVGSIDVAASGFTAGSIRTHGGSATVNVGTGSIEAHRIDTSGAAGSSGGNIALSGREIAVGSLISNAGDGVDLQAGTVHITGITETGLAADISIGGDISAESSNGDQVTATIKIEGSCADCENRVSFNSDSFITGRVDVLGSSSNLESITVSNVASRWTIHGDNSHQIRHHDDGDNSGGLITFSGFETLVGSEHQDRFEIAALPSLALKVLGSEAGGDHEYDVLHGPSLDGPSVIEWTINGRNQGFVRLADGSGSSVQFEGIGYLEGGLASNRFQFDSEGSVHSIDGGEGYATIRGKNANNVWSLETAGDFSVREADASESYLEKFTNVERLEGGDLADEFRIEVAFHGDIASGGGHDVFKIGKAAFVSRLDGGAAGGRTDTNSATIHGPDAHNLWIVDGLGGEGKLAATTSIDLIQSFVNITDLVGGDEVDEFTVNAAFSGSLFGEGGDDQFRINAPVIGDINGGDGHDYFAIDAVVGGSVDGASGNDRFEINAAVLGSVNGGTGDDEFVLGSQGSVGSIHGGDGVDRLVGRDEASTWVVEDEGVGKLQRMAGEAYVSAFTGIEALQGGADADTFVFSGSGAVGEIRAGDGVNTIIGKDGATTWEIDGNNAGRIRGLDGTLYVSDFSQVENLQGGAGNDTFVFDQEGSISGVVTGGGGIDSIVGRGIDSLWTITGVNTGRIGDAEDVTYLQQFREIENLRGADADDHFIFLHDSSRLSGVLDGGRGNNSVLGRPSDTSWHLTDAHTGYASSHTTGRYVDFVRIQAVIGDAGSKNSLYGRDQDNQWRVTGNGSGTLAASNNGSVDAIAFAGMTSLFGNSHADNFTFTTSGFIADEVAGGAGDDTFELFSGSVGRLLRGGDGHDRMQLSVVDGVSGTLTADAIEEILALGNSDSVRHSFESSAKGALQFTSSGQDYRINYQGAEQVSDNVVANSLIVTGRSLEADEVSISGSNQYTFNGLLPWVSFGNKANVTFDLDQQDAVILRGDINVSGALTLREAAVDYQSGLLQARDLYLDGTSSVGSRASRLQTRVENISLMGTRGDIFISEHDDLNIYSPSINGIVDIYLGGSLRSSSAVASDHAFLVESTGGDIHLSHKNRFNNSLSLSAKGSIELVNGTATRFAHLAADSVIIDSTGDITAESSVRIENNATFRSTGSVVLADGGNRFGSIRVDGAGLVQLGSDRGFGVNGIQASGAVSIWSRADLDLAGKIGTSDVLNVQAQGRITQNGDLAGSTISVQGDNGIFMGADAKSIATEWIAYDGSEISLGHLEAREVDVLSSSSILDSNGSLVNVIAERLNLIAESGVGGSDALETMVGTLFVSNNTGSTQIVNGQEVWITGLQSNGDIRFHNTNGSVYLAVAGSRAYQRYNRDARFAGGVMDANYEIGTLMIDVDNGHLLTSSAPDITYPVLSARNMSLTIPRGGIGQPLYPLVVYVKDNLVLVSARPSWIRYAFESPPMNIDDSGTISGDITDLIGAGSEQMVEIEPLADIDPAIFTGVRNFSYDDVAIRLPDDQLYYLDEDEGY